MENTTPFFTTTMQGFLNSLLNAVLDKTTTTIELLQTSRDEQTLQIIWTPVEATYGQQIEYATRLSCSHTNTLLRAVLKESPHSLRVPLALAVLMPLPKFSLFSPVRIPADQDIEQILRSKLRRLTTSKS